MPISPPSNSAHFTDLGFTSLRRSADHGFTLIELLVVLTILSLLAVVIAPQFVQRSTTLERHKLRVTLEMALRTAQHKARAGGAPVAVDPGPIGDDVRVAQTLAKEAGPVLVYPDGSTSGGLVLRDGRPVLGIDWLTGRIVDAS